MTKTNTLRATAALLAGLLLAGGCAYMDVRRPLDQNFDRTELGKKEGQAHSYSVLYLVAWGDAGAKAAARNGDIQVIRYADTEIFSILFGLYTRLTTIAYGD